MAIIRWNPRNISSFFDEDFEFPTIPLLSRLGQGLNLYETEDSVVAEAAVPGIPEENIDVTIEDGIVRISASTEEKEEEKAKRRHFMRTLSKSYNYSFRLPEDVSPDIEPEVILADGVLTLTFPKLEKTPPKKIKVKRKPKVEKK